MIEAGILLRPVATGAAGKDPLMTARQLLALFDSIYLLSMAGLVGGIAFFSFVVAPILFRVLGAEAGGRFVRTLFPRYYAWSAILAAIALPSLVAGPLCYPEFRGPAVGVQAAILLAIILVMQYAGNSLVPQINRARDEGPSASDRFERLHRRSVWLNVASMVAGIGLLIAFACRPAPRTLGIIERSPQERARLEAESVRPGSPSTGGEGRPTPSEARGGIHPGGT